MNSENTLPPLEPVEDAPLDDTNDPRRNDRQAEGGANFPRADQPTPDPDVTDEVGDGSEYEEEDE